MGGTVRRWEITDEFGQRLGCGVITAVILPVWFFLILFAVDDTAALAVAAGLFVVTAVFAGLALRRARRLPRSVELGGDAVRATVATLSRSGRREAPVDQLARVDIGTSLGVWPLRLTFVDGTVWRLPRHLDDLDGFLAALQERNAALVITDHNPPEPDGPPDGPA